MKSWQYANRAAAMTPSIIREILKVTERPDIISFAGGLPSPQAFPVQEFREAFDKVMSEHPRAALQYSSSEGFAPLREWVAASLPWQVHPDQVLITTGSRRRIQERPLHGQHLLHRRRGHKSADGQGQPGKHNPLAHHAVAAPAFLKGPRRR